MKSISDAVYQQWAEEKYDRPDPEEIKPDLNAFRETLDKCTVMTGSRKEEVWQAMIALMATVSEYSFKSGFKCGVSILEETSH